MLYLPVFEDYMTSDIVSDSCRGSLEWAFDYLCSAYVYSRDRGFDSIDLYECLVPSKVSTVVQCLRQIGVSKLTASFTNSRYSNYYVIPEVLYRFEQNGYTVIGTTLLSYIDTCGSAHDKYALILSRLW